MQRTNAYLTGCCGVIGSTKPERADRRCKSIPKLAHFTCSARTPAGTSLHHQAPSKVFLMASFCPDCSAESSKRVTLATVLASLPGVDVKRSPSAAATLCGVQWSPNRAPSRMQPLPRTGRAFYSRSTKIDCRSKRTSAAFCPT